MFRSLFAYFLEFITMVLVALLTHLAPVQVIDDDDAIKNLLEISTDLRIYLRP